MNLLLLRAIVARVPAVAWLALIMLASSVSLYALAMHRGRVQGRQEIVRIARADSIAHQRAAVTAAAVATDRVVAVARKAKAVADSGRTRLVPARALAAPLLDSTPAPVVQYVAALEQQVANDSVAQAVLAVVPDTAAVERAARVGLDTLQEHARDDAPAGPDGVSTRDVLAGVGVVAIVVEGVRLLVHLVRR